MKKDCKKWMGRFGFVPIIFSVNLVFGDSFQCGTDPAVGPPVAVFPLSKGIAVYACGSGSAGTLLPGWWQNIWKKSVQLSVPRFFIDNSGGGYEVNVDPYSYTQQLCFSSNYSIGVDGFDPAFFRDIMTQADEVINFADPNYDRQPADGIVDGLFFIVVNHPPGFNGRYPKFDGVLYVTKDSVGVGPPKIIHGSRTTFNRVNSQEQAVAVCSHEWAHVLGLPDLYGDVNPFFRTWNGVGGFSAMGTGWPEDRITPLDPWSRSKLGWVTPIEVTAPLYGQSIPDYMTSGTVYRLAKDSSEYFLITNHRGITQAQDSSAFWEEKFRGFGILIWHVDTTGDPYLRQHKLMDLELAQGLYDPFDPADPCNLTTTPNPLYGWDTLDLCASGGFPNTEEQSGRCFYNSVTQKTTFDRLSNPSSDGYRDSVVNEIRVQDIPSRLAIRKIQSTQFSPATADLLVNNWFGHITQNTTWSGFVAMTGDVTVDSGFTLTISPGAVVYAQYDEDNQNSGAHTAKCEFIVKPGGRLIIGGPGNPVKIISSRPESQAGLEDWGGIVVKPGGIFSIENAIIRHAYAAIEDSSAFNHTIKNVRIGRCKAYGILACKTDSLTIRGCRIDSVNGSPGGYGIYVSSQSYAGARVVKDTIKACGYGIYVSLSTGRVDSCVIEAASGGLTSLGGLWNQLQGSLGSDSLLVSYTGISGYFTSGEIFHNFFQGRVVMVGCTLVSSVANRTSNGIRNTAGSYLKLRGSTVTEWGQNGIITAHYSGQETNLGVYSSDNGNNAIYTSMTGSTWKYVLDIDGGSAPIIKAEKNCWNNPIPPASRFSPNVDYTPVDNFCISDPGPKVAGGEGEILPRQTELFQNYPNPFNPTTLIQFNLEKTEKVNLEIFNLLGQTVRTMLDGEEFSAGPYTFLWNGKDDRGNSVASGTYFYRLRTPTFEQSRKMMLVK